MFGNFHIIDTPPEPKLRLGHVPTSYSQEAVARPNVLVALVPCGEKGKTLPSHKPNASRIVISSRNHVNPCAASPPPKHELFLPSIYTEQAQSSPATPRTTIPSTATRPHMSPPTAEPRSSGSSAGRSSAGARLRVVLVILAEPDLPDHGGVAEQPAHEDDGVGDDGLGAALPEGDGGEADEGPEQGAEDEAREEGDGALHPDEDLEGEEEEREQEAEEDDVGRLLQRAGAAVRERRDERLQQERGALQEEERVRGHGAERAAGVEDVVVEELEGLLGEDAWGVCLLVLWWRWGWV